MFLAFYRNKHMASLLQGAIFSYAGFIGYFLGKLSLMYFYHGVRVGWPTYIPALCAASGLLVSAGFNLLQLNRWRERLLLGAQAALPEVYPVYHRVTQEMFVPTGVEIPPELYVVDSDKRNAWSGKLAHGRSAIVVTSALLQSLQEPQLRAVVAREMTRLRHRDFEFFLVLSGVTMPNRLFCFLLCFGACLSSFAIGFRQHTDTFFEGPLFIVLSAVHALLSLDDGFYRNYFLFLSQLAGTWYLASKARQSREQMADLGAVVATRDPVAVASALEIAAQGFHDTCEVEVLEDMSRDLLMIKSDLKFFKRRKQTVSDRPQVKSRPLPEPARKLDATMVKRMQDLRKLVGTPVLTWQACTDVVVRKDPA